MATVRTATVSGFQDASELAGPEGTRRQYRAALAVFAGTAGECGLSKTAIHSLCRLNAAFYLEDYLPDWAHARAVQAAATALAGAYRGLRPRPSGNHARTTCSVPGRGDEATCGRRLFDAVERHLCDPDVFIAAQHVLEVLPDLPETGRGGLIDAAESYLTDVAAGQRSEVTVDFESDQLRCWAEQNGRPPREGEIAAWGRCISKREPKRLLEQALASGLTFDSLLDALTTAAATQAIRLPTWESGELLVAAHAARRLTTLGDRPAISAWLCVARRLFGRLDISKTVPHPTTPAPRDLALAAVRSGDAHLVQVVEATLVERESLPAAMAPLVLQALAKLLSGRSAIRPPQKRINLPRRGDNERDSLMSTKNTKLERRLQGKIALITGASRGLGRAIALAYADEGAGLVLASRQGSTAELQTVQAAVEARGAQALSVSGDVSSRGDVERLSAEALARFGRVDVLINNASALGPVPMPFLLDTPVAAFQDVLETNVLAPFLLIRTLAGQMLARGSGLVINVSSDAGVVGYPQWGAYGVSKAALDQLTRVWAAELEGTGTGIVSIDPGSMNTLMHRMAEPDEDPSGWADPEEIAPIFVALALAGPERVNGRRYEAQADGLLQELSTAVTVAIGE